MVQAEDLTSMVKVRDLSKAFDEKMHSEIEDYEPKKGIKWLLDGNMKGKYLGVCLDNCRWGSIDTVLWDVDTKGMVSFIENWFEQNKENFEGLIVVDETCYQNMEIPRIIEKKCGHDGPIHIDVNGNKRCIYRNNVHNSYLLACNKIIIDESEEIFSLEKVISRKNLSEKFPRNQYWMTKNKVITPFDGFRLAGYVKLWYDQEEGMPPFYNPNSNI